LVGEVLDDQRRDLGKIDVPARALKAAEGLTRPRPVALVVIGYGLAFWLMSTSMDMLPVAVVYAIWSGVGMVDAAIGGVLLFGEAVTISILSVALIGAGVTVLAAGHRNGP